MKIAITQAWWTQNVDMGAGKFDKSCHIKDVNGLWLLGTGVLIEREGRRDRYVPLGNVLTIEAAEELTPEQWAGEPVSEAPKAAPKRTRTRQAG